jgi:hypothetical protein
MGQKGVRMGQRAKPGLRYLCLHPETQLQRLEKHEAGDGER